MVIAILPVCKIYVKSWALELSWLEIDKGGGQGGPGAVWVLVVEQSQILGRVIPDLKWRKDIEMVASTDISAHGLTREAPAIYSNGLW